MFNFTLTIEENDGPVINQTIAPTSFTLHSGKPGSFTHNTDLFSDPEGDTVSIAGSFSPDPGIFTYTEATRQIAITAPTDAQVANYTFTATGHDVYTDNTNATQTVRIYLEIVL